MTVQIFVGTNENFPEKNKIILLNFERWPCRLEFFCTVQSVFIKCKIEKADSNEPDIVCLHFLLSVVWLCTLNKNFKCLRAHAHGMDFRNKILFEKIFIGFFGILFALSFEFPLIWPNINYSSIYFFFSTRYIDSGICSLTSWFQTIKIRLN